MGHHPPIMVGLGFSLGFRGESDGKEHGTLTGHWVYVEAYRAFNAGA